MVENDADVVHNVADLVRRAAARVPAKPALLAGPVQLTWRELDARVDQTAAGLRRLGLIAGDRVALQLGNTPDFPAAYFGALRAGLVAVLANTGYTEPELRHLLIDAGARVLVTSSVAAIEAAGSLRAQVRSLAAVVVAAPSGPDGTTTLADLLAAAPAAQRAEASSAGGVRAGRSAGGNRPAGAGGEDLAALLYTSGTSGRPRGAMLTHRALLANLEQCAAIQPAAIDAEDIVLLALPMFHVYGLNAGLGLVAWAGATGVLVERFDPAETLELMRRHLVTNCPAVPPMYQAWLAEPGLAAAFGSVRVATSGGAPLPPAVQRRYAEAGIRLHEGYGLTEAAPALTSTLVGGTPKAGSIGRPIPGVELTLRDPEGAAVDDDDTGEIAVRGPNLFSGYWPDGRDGPDADGWFATGDVAFADDDGDLHLVDRRTDLILVNGFNVYPAEVEAVLCAHPGIAEAAVVGVPDDRLGEAVRGYAVLRPGIRLPAAELLDWAATALARFKLPASVEFLDELPHTATGKISRGRLRQRARTAAAAPAAARSA